MIIPDLSSAKVMFSETVMDNGIEKINFHIEDKDFNGDICLEATIPARAICPDNTSDPDTYGYYEPDYSDDDIIAYLRNFPTSVPFKVIHA